MNFGVIMYQTSTSKGQELVAQRMTKELASQEGKAVLITSRFHDFRPVISADEVRRNGGYVRFEDSNLGIEVYRVESRKVDWPPRRIEFSNFISVLDRIVGELDLDVLISHSTLWNGPDLTAQFISWKRRMFVERGEAPPIFCHMSHFQPPSKQRYSLQEREWRRSWNEYVLKRIIREADFLLVTTPKAERHMVELGASREQCLLFPGGIEVPRRSSPGELDEFRQRHGVDAGEKLVVFLGTVEERKNVGAILRVARILRKRTDLLFVIAGRMEGAYGRRIMSNAHEAPNVSILGEIDDDEKAALVGASYLNFTMSKLEALGLTQLEFMSAGVPVVTSGVGGQSWVVKNRHTGVVLRGPRDTKGAANAIERLVDDPEYRARLGRDAERFASRLTMKVLVKNLVLNVRKKLEQDDAGEIAAHQNGEDVGLPLTSD
jgi:glycosyltransferase involved in cell wall biosynthesis